MARILPAFIVGIGLSGMLNDSILQFSVLCLFCTIFLLFDDQRKWRSFPFLSPLWSGILVNVLLILLGSLLAGQHRMRHGQKVVIETDREVMCIGKLNDFIRDTAQWGRNELLIKAMRKNGEWIEMNERILVVMERKYQKSPANRYLIFHAPLMEIPAPQFPYEFDYKNYLRKKGIFHQAFLSNRNYEWIQSGKEEGIGDFFFNCRNLIIQNLHAHIKNDRNRAVLLSLLVGDKRDLSRSQKRAYSSAGVMHILAVSGLHVGTLYLIVHLLFSFLGKTMKTMLSLFILWSYCFLAGLSPSIVRACSLFSIVLVGQLFDQRISQMNILLASALVLLIVNPDYLSDVGFQLSYLAVGGIMLIQPLLYPLISFRLFAIDKIWSLATVSIAAQLATLPISLYYFNQFPTYFLLSNIVIVPAAILIFYIGIFLSVFFWFDPISGLLAIPANYLLDGLNDFVTIIEELPMASIKNIFLTHVDVSCLYAFIITFILFFQIRRARWLLIALVFLLILCSSFSYRKYAIRRQSAFMTFDLKGKTGLGFIRNDHLCILSDEIAPGDQTVLFRLNSMIGHMGIKSVEWLKLNTFKRKAISLKSYAYKAGTYLQFMNERMLILNHQGACVEEHQKKLVLDVLVVLNESMCDAYVANYCKPGMVILTGSISEKSRNKWTAWCNRFNVVVHDVTGEPFIKTW